MAGESAGAGEGPGPRPAGLAGQAGPGSQILGGTMRHGGTTDGQFPEVITLVLGRRTQL